jgi:signal transduction histidine kinase
VRPSLKAKGIKFFVKSNSEIEEIRINESFYDIFHVFNNLIINAEKALESTNKKEIYLIAEKIENKNMYFHVCDTGIGILDENKEKIFKVGYSTTNGTGLGLPYIREVLNKIGGKIRFIGASNDFSTTFEVIIPAKKQ